NDCEKSESNVLTYTHCDSGYSGLIFIQAAGGVRVCLFWFIYDGERVNAIVRKQDILSSEKFGSASFNSGTFRSEAYINER
ncbi:MAG: hypothetical protein ACRDBO_20400, partial [Lachnospiraceae bacterium]